MGRFALAIDLIQLGAIIGLGIAFHRLRRDLDA